MSTLALAKKKYARKTATMGENWKKGVTDKADTYAKYMAEFLGIPAIRGSRKEAWSAGTRDVTAEDFKNAVAGKETKWADKLVGAFE